MGKIICLILLAGFFGSINILAQLTSGSTYKIINLKNNEALDVNAEGIVNGTNIQTWSDINSKAQKWIAVDNDDGTFSFMNPNSQKVLDVDGGGTMSASNAQIWSFIASAGQKWDVINNGDGSYSLKHSSSGKVLGVKYNSINVELITDRGTTAQKWQFVEITPVTPVLDLSGFNLICNYTFGTDASRTVSDLTDLDLNFKPYGIAGTTVINNEWQRYQPFNTINHHFVADRLELTALPDLGGIYDGGISSGQIISKETFYPSDDKTYVFQLRALISHGTGTWPAFWMYSPGGSGTTDSEIDIFEFFNNETQNTYDWTGFDHGAAVGGDYYSIMTNQWVWHPGFDFAADYHVYTLVWKEGSIQKWVDNTLVKGSLFGWFGPPPEILVNLAIGGNPNSPPTADDTPFPSKFILDYLKIYEFNPWQKSATKQSDESLKHAEISSDPEIEVEVFPNPSRGEITIKGIDGAAVEIFDLSGRKMLSSAQDETGIIYFRGHYPGLYILKIKKDTILLTKNIFIE